MSDIDIEELLVRSLSGEVLSPQDEARLSAWRAERPEHQQQMDDMRATWAMLGKRRLRVPERAPLGDAISHRAARASRPDRRRWMHAAWMVPGLAAAALALLMLRPPGERERPQPVTYATAAQEMTNVRLADGTLVRLGPESRIDVVPGSGGRELHLRGEAFFAVVSRPDQPFRIRTDGGDVTVRGTRFDVRAAADEVDLIVVDGRVELSAGQQMVEVVGGEVSRVKRGVVSAPTPVENVFALLAWMDGTMVFNATPLPRVAAEIGHRFNVRVDLAPALASQTVTAVFSDRPLTEVLDVVCGLVQASCRVDDIGARVVIEPYRRPQ